MLEQPPTIEPIEPIEPTMTTARTQKALSMRRLYGRSGEYATVARFEYNPSMDGMVRFVRLARQLGFLLALLAPGSVHAHPRVERAVELARMANFEAALHAFEEAEAAEDLQRDDLLELYEARALVHFALSNHVELEADLGRLASLDPERQLGGEFPPEIATTFRELAAEQPGLLTVVVTPSTDRGRIRLQAHTENDIRQLVTRTTIHGRVDGGPWRRLRGDTLEVDADGLSEIEYYAVAIGAGGVHVAALGSEESPEVFRLSERPPGPPNGGVVDPTTPTIPPAAVVAPPREQDPEPRRAWIWWTVGGSVAAAGIVTALVLSLGGTTYSSPQPTWPAL